MHNSAPQTGRLVSGMERPGAFQCMLLRACDLQETDREVFLLKEVKGRSLAEIATILQISSGEASKRLKRARREVCPMGISDGERAGEATPLANVRNAGWFARNRFFHMTVLRGLAFLTIATDQATLAGWSRDAMRELIGVVHRVAPTVMVVALNIFR